MVFFVMVVASFNALSASPLPQNVRMTWNPLNENGGSNKLMVSWAEDMRGIDDISDLCRNLVSVQMRMLIDRWLALFPLC